MLERIFVREPRPKYILNRCSARIERFVRPATLDPFRSHPLGVVAARRDEERTRRLRAPDVEIGEKALSRICNQRPIAGSAKCGGGAAYFSRVRNGDVSDRYRSRISASDIPTQRRLIDTELVGDER